MILVTRKVKHKEIKSTNNLKNGGYVMYWKLYKQLHGMLCDKNNALQKLRNNYTQSSLLLDMEIEKRILWQLFWAKCYTYTIGFIWFCLLKPLGQFTSKIIYISGKYKMINDTVFENVDLTKSTTYKLFNITVWKSYNQKLTKEELTNLKK